MNNPAAETAELDVIRGLALNRSAVIEAGAGTGKTFNIAFMVLRLLLGPAGAGDPLALSEPLRLENILLVTFTRAAASELRDRVRGKIRHMRAIFGALAEKKLSDCLSAEELKERQYGELAASYLNNPADDGRWLAETLERLRTDPGYRSEVRLSDLNRRTAREKERALLRAEREIDSADIRTIHSFCNSVLNQIHAFEAGEPFDIELKQDLTRQSHRAACEIFRELFYLREDAPLLLQAAGSPDEDDYAGLMDKLMGVRVLYGKLPGSGTAGEDAQPAVLNLAGYAVRLSERCYKAVGGCLRFSDPKRMLDAILKDLAERLPALAQEASDSLKSFAGAYGGGQARTAHEGRKWFLILQNEHKLLKNPVMQAEVLIECAGRLSYPADVGELKVLYGRLCKHREKGCLLHKLNSWSGGKGGGKAADRVPEDLQAFERAASEATDALERLCEALEAPAELLRLLIAMMIIERFEEICERERVMSYDEVLRKMALALRRTDSTLARQIRGRYRAAIIDEFQDTDPVQFEIFNAVYLKDGASGEVPGPGSYCFIIGDPKQSIYGFRGADINFYINAKQRIKDNAQGQTAVYSLRRNFRSAPALVQGVNALFTGRVGQGLDQPFGDSGFGFEECRAERGKLFFRFGREPRPSLSTANFIRRVETEDGEKLKEVQARLAAADLYEVLTRGWLGEDELRLASGEKGRRVRADEIAVLVSGESEYRILDKALRVRGIPSVFYSDKTSVLLESPDAGGGKNTARISREARSLIYLMEAMLDCSDQNRFLRLLGSSLFKTDAAGFCRIRESAALKEQEAELLRGCAALWERKGFLAAFTRWLKSPVHARCGVPAFLGAEGGGRELANLQQIAEIIQKFQGEIRGTYEQLRAFRSLIEEGKKLPLPPELTRRRLESESGQVKVYTVHKAKGLEFPIVFTPFLWGYRKNTGKKPPYYSCYDPSLGRVILTPEEKPYRMAEDAEAIRKVYVALTRAVAANFLYIGGYIGGTQSGTTSHGFNRLLGNKSNNDAAGDTERILASLGQLKLEGRDEPLFTCLPPLSGAQENGRYQPPPEAGEGQTARHPPEAGEEQPVPPRPSRLKRPVSRDFVIASYSDIVSGLYGNEAGDFAPGESEAVGDRAPARFSFPRGTAPGTFLHELLRGCDFARVSDEAYRKDLIAAREADDYQGVLRRWRPESAGTRSGMWAGELATWLEDITRARLGPAMNAAGGGGAREDFCLGALAGGEYIPEMDFLLPLRSGKTYDDLNELCRDNARALGLDASGLLLAPARRRISLKGYLTGSIDLVFAHGGRFYVVDYKSNFLGCRAEAYDSRSIRDNVFSPEHRYDMQYLIYSCALRKFLKARLGSGYDYSRHFGGVLYLYLRGLYAGQSAYGVFATRPGEELIARFERELVEE